jgi:hypothetical protein
MVFNHKVQENKLISEYLGFKFVFFIKTTQSKIIKSE